MKDFQYRPAYEIADAWYTPARVHQALIQSSPDPSCWDAPPANPHSREFAEWMSLHLRTAMTKGIQIGRANDRPYTFDQPPTDTRQGDQP